MKYNRKTTHISKDGNQYYQWNGIWRMYNSGAWVKVRNDDEFINENLTPIEALPPSELINQLGTFGEPEQGKKSDDNKPPMELLPSNGLIEVAKAMGYGAKKYNESWPDMNWPKVKNAKRRYLGAALRHIMARLGGEVHDPESGELHVAHAAFCLLALCEFDGGYRKESK